MEIYQGQNLLDQYGQICKTNFDHFAKIELNSTLFNLKNGVKSMFFLELDKQQLELSDSDKSCHRLVKIFRFSNEAGKSSFGIKIEFLMNFLN